MKILTAKQMGEVDRLTTERFGIPSILLMENAGRSVADCLHQRFPDLTERSVLIVCGTGNNGGDGLVVARHLASRGCRPDVWILGDPARYKGDALANWKMFQSLGLEAQILPDAKSREAAIERTAFPDLIVDGLFGTGLSKPVGAEYRMVVEWINRARPAAFVVAIDLPSGVFADSSVVEGSAVRADMTVTFTTLKAALVFPPACEFAGRIVVAPIGSPIGLLENPDYRTEIIDLRRVRRALPPRDRNSHKGTFGHVFALAGSKDKSGAALMCGIAALRSGAGLVTLMLPESLCSDVIGKIPELMTVWLPETRDGTPAAGALNLVIEHLRQADAVVVGPGLSTDPSTQELIRSVVLNAPAPVVLDADGLNAFAGNVKNLRNLSSQPIAITPHPGEMARLLSSTIAEIQARRLEVATGCAVDHQLFTVLKGHQTVVADPDGRIFVNCTGNPGMATGGTGDILSGMMGRFLAGWRRRKDPDLRDLADYLSAAVYLHGLAGDLAAKEKGEESLIATDLLDHLPAAIQGVWEP
jgi:ADP-dependent NAD(P)H-hydrate dehydratase / NAD(P)H-hydrate epimerase